jgi:hypothetical protein
VKDDVQNASTDIVQNVSTDNIQNASIGRCVLFGPSSIDPVNGPSSGGRLTTIYGQYFGSSADAKVITKLSFFRYSNYALLSIQLT